MPSSLFNNHKPREEIILSSSPSCFLFPPLLSPKKNILSIKRDNLTSYIKNNYCTNNRMVLFGASGVDHVELVKAAEVVQHTPRLPEPIPTWLQGPSKARLCWIGCTHLQRRHPDGTHRCCYRRRQLVITRLLPHAHHAVHLWQLGPHAQLGVAPLLASLRHNRKAQPHQLIHVLLDVLLGHRPVGDLPRHGEPCEPGRPTTLYASRVDPHEHRANYRQGRAKSQLKASLLLGRDTTRTDDDSNNNNNEDNEDSDNRDEMMVMTATAGGGQY
jgi:hypothetical protein